MLIVQGGDKAPCKRVAKAAPRFELGIEDLQSSALNHLAMPPFFLIKQKPDIHKVNKQKELAACFSTRTSSEQSFHIEY